MRIVRSVLKKILPRIIKKKLYLLYTFLPDFLNRRRAMKEIIKISKERPKNKKPLKIFIWEPSGVCSSMNLLGVIGLGLKTRGHSVKLLLCQGSKIACTKRNFSAKDNPLRWQKKCKRCAVLCKRQAKLLNLDYAYIDDYICKDRLKELYKLAQKVKFEDIYDFTFRGHKIGKNVYSTMIKYLEGLPVVREQEMAFKLYLYASLVSIEIAENLIAQEKPDRVIMYHAGYSDNGPACSVFFSHNIPVVVDLGITGGRRVHNFSFIQDTQRPTSQMILEKTWEKYKSKKLSKLENEQIENFFHNYYNKNISLDVSEKSLSFTPHQKARGVSSWMDGSKTRRAKSPKSRALASGGGFIDFKNKNFKNNNPIWCIFSHLNWDSVDAYSMVYKDFDKWIIDTVKHIIEIKTVNWLIKIHPAELIYGSGYPVSNVIEDYFGKLPSHIKILPKGTNINTWELYKNITGGITMFGTPGLELAALGKPVILAGNTHYAQKGFTFDGLTHEKYIYYLRNVKKLKPLSKSQLEKARVYAFLYFIKKQILIPEKLEEFKPRKDKYVDFVSDCIINKKDFILP